MGIILFFVARDFTTIVGFVEARRMVMIDGNTAIAEAVSPNNLAGDEGDDNGYSSDGEYESTDSADGADSDEDAEGEIGD